jgi:hypothetical protein
MGIVGRTYLERGEPVTVLIQWGPGGGPRNVLVRRQSGEQVVRPFRGLRRPPEPTPAADVLF